jgi:hypothetical protein
MLHYSGNEMEDWKGGHIACMIISEADRYVSTKTKKRISFERPRRRRENNIKMDLKYVGCGFDSCGL